MLLALAVLVFLSLPLLVQACITLVRREWEQIVEQRARQRAVTPSIERVAADLRRLRGQLEARENQPGITGKGLKMGAVRTAYVEVLCTACQQLEVRPPDRPGRLQTPLAEIYRVEAELRSRGLDVRMPHPVGERR